MRLKFLGLLFSFLVASLGGLGGYFLYDYYERPALLTAPLTLFVNPGQSVTRIAQQLAQAGLLRYPRLWHLGAQLQGKSHRLQAGEYLFTTPLSPAQILDKLIAGQVVEHTVTIPEGLTVRQVIARLDALPLLRGAIDTLPPEGSLLPETYTYRYQEHRQTVLQRMQKAMTQTLQHIWHARAPHLPYTQMEDLVILASIVEKETSQAAERPRVAAVFLNRLRRGMPLQADPTVLYGLQQLLPNKQGLSLQDLAFNTPYNTYLHRGLPPTPITCPGRAALMAAAQPLASDELYFVADGTGAHQFSRTLKDHQHHHKRWRRIRQGRSPE